MGRLEDIKQLQIAVMKQAAARFSERRPERSEARMRAARGGPASADTPERVKAFRKLNEGRALAKAIVTTPLERLIGGEQEDFDFQPNTDTARDAGRPVARIVTMSDGFAPQGFGTGFMVSSRLLMTNNHVLPDDASVTDVYAQFDYEYVGKRLKSGELFELDPDEFFMTSEKLDFTLVAVRPTSRNGGSLSSYGHHKLISTIGKILIDQPVSIIQHPDARPKSWAETDNKLLDVLDNHLHYETDTLPGSSGSPTFNAFWDVVALHHSGVPEMRDGKIMTVSGGVWDENTGSDKDINWIANEGVRVSRLIDALRKAKPRNSGEEVLWREVLDASVAAPVAPKAERAIAVVAPSAVAVAPAVPDAIAVAPAAIETGSGVTIHIHGSASFVIGGAAPAERRYGAAEKVQLLEKKLTFDQDYTRRRGYQTDFLTGLEIGLPKAAAVRLPEMYRDRHGTEQILDYHHFSLGLNAVWRMPMWTAVNANFNPEVRIDVARTFFGEDTWIPDPRVPTSMQLMDPEFYKPARKFDRGHIVRRDDNEWGTTQEEIVLSNSDTFHWTNCTPQHEAFNQENKKGIWGKLESHISAEKNAIGGKAVIFAGPVLRNERDHALDHDWGGGVVRIPLSFWKIIVVAERVAGKSVARAYAFELNQKEAIERGGLEALRPEEAFNVGAFSSYQTTVASIAKLTGVNFPPEVLAADTMDGGTGAERRRLAQLADATAARPTAQRRAGAAPAGPRKRAGQRQR
jgi:endonuclease G